MNQTLVRAIVDLRDRTLQKSRVAFGLRCSAVERGADQMNPEQLAAIQRWEERFAQLEAEADEEIKGFVREEPIVQAMIQVKGVGLMLAAKAVCMIDIRRADTVSALWRYSGYGMGQYWADATGKIVAPIHGFQWKKNGKGEKELIEVTPTPEPDWTLIEHRDIPVEGWVLSYNKRLKTTCFLIGSSFLRSGSPYRKVYDDARIYYEANRPDWIKGRQHNAAMRKMIKVWLSHLWEVWRKLEGLPTRELYVNDRLNHEHYFSPEEFGWNRKAASIE